MNSLAPAPANITSPANLPSWESDILADGPALSPGGFEVDAVPPTFTSAPEGIDDLAQISRFVVITPARTEADALVQISMTAVAVTPENLARFSALTTCVPGTVERLARSTGVAVFTVAGSASQAAAEAVRSAVNGLGALGIDARSYTLPHGHATLHSWLKEAGAHRVERALTAAAGRVRRMGAGALSGGYIPLGYSDSTYYVWSVDQGEMKKIPEMKLKDSSLIMSLVGNKYLWDNYCVENPKTGKKTQDLGAFAGNLRDACVRLKGRSMSKTRGSGVWREGEDLVVNSDEAFYSSDGALADRVNGQHIYLRVRNLGITHDQVAASTADVQNVLSFLKTFRFQRGESDAMLMLGWLFLSFICGALPHRPHAFVHADAGSGKSTLLKFIRFLLGDAHYSASDANEPSLRQSLGKTSIAAILDESGADSAHIATLLRFFRLSYDGTNKGKGGSDGKPTDYEIRSMGLLCGVTAPEMDSQEARRFLMFGMQPTDGNSGGPQHQLFTLENADENPLVSDLGRKMFKRSLDSWPRLRHAMTLLRGSIGRRLKAKDPAADTLVPVIASAFVALHDHDLADDAAADAWLAKFDIRDDLERVQNVASGEEFLEKLASIKVTTKAAGFSTEMTISELWARAHDDEPREGAWRRELGMHGMAIGLDANGGTEVRISSTLDGFNELMAKTKWKIGSIDSLIRRARGALPYQKKMPAKIGTIDTRFLSVPYVRGTTALPKLSAPDPRN